MEWNQLLSNARLHGPGAAGKPSRSNFVQDYDRVIFSAPFRRLANKTQVQPLYENDHVHHRLIHSVEVGSVGRTLGMEIGQWLVSEGHLVRGQEYDLADIVQAACAAHDIGNPPFGHSGEEAIGAWFAARFVQPQGLLADLDPVLQRQFEKFEGNAQGFRIIARLEMYRNDGGMRLSKATLGAFTKYPLTAATQQALAAAGPALLPYKKFGIFNAEAALFDEVAATLGLPRETYAGGHWYRRHPLVFAVEAADDICYRIVDLEDAFTTGELPYEQVRDLLQEVTGTAPRSRGDRTEAEHIEVLRAMAIGAAIRSCVEVFQQNHAAIMAGHMSGGLIERSTVGPIFRRISDLAVDRIFTAPRKTELEVSGRRVIDNVMTGVLPVYEDLARKGWDRERLEPYSKQLARALGLDLRDIGNAEQALHGLADFTSGMTDRYALRISRMLSGT
ncbi:dGTP triphosphohydrolase [Paracoccus xiamenensis]|uniref:dGTP triphosphohydrolase n=1 Tax=Paracoccus xiamenensis TaxID=2714901 RepID=UPI001407B81D|nr:dNTP triphosphohydrolase [Paracoccus xiamenensis]NHF73277.1 dNTP triphosphohydrolase [Paracoccus xiamenensis]